MFSVVIPTLQRSPELWPIVDQCCAHPLVLEVLVINNAPEPLAWASPKVRVLAQAENIYVNPAWNLGAREARAEWLAILNDDVRFPDEALTHAAHVLSGRIFGMVGPRDDCYFTHPTGPVRHRVAPKPGGYYGTFMCLRRQDYVPVPDDMPIWGGDDWLFYQQRKPPAFLTNLRLESEMGTTSRAPEFQACAEKNWAASMRALGQVHPQGVGRGIYGSHWWHRPARVVARASDLPARLRRMARAVGRRLGARGH